MNKTLNLVLMVLMACLALREGYDIMTNGANTYNVLFGLLFTAFAVRRFMLFSRV